MRVLLWIIGVPVLLLIAAAVLLPLFIDERALVALAAEKIEAQSGVKLKIDGEASLSLFPRVSLATTGVTVEIPDSSTHIEAQSLRAGVALMPLLRRSVEIDSIVVSGLTLRTLASDDSAQVTAALDTSNMSNAELDAFYAARKQLRLSAQAEAAADLLAAPMALEVGELSLRDIRLITVDAAGKTISELQLNYLTASDLNTDGRPVPLSLQLLIPGDADAAPVDVTLEVQFTADLDAEKVTLTELALVVSGATPDTIRLSAEGSFAMDTQVADLNLELAVGSLTGEGKLRFASFASPQIDATLKLSELNPALLILAGPEAAGAAAESSDTGGGAAALPLHALRMIDTRAVLSIDTVVLDPHVLENVKATLRVVDGVATLDPVTATLHGGEIGFKAVFNARYNTARMNTEGAVKRLDLAQALGAMEAGVAASGKADLDWSLSGSGRSSEALTASLAGPINVNTQDITLEGIGMEQMLCRGVALANQQTLQAEFPTNTRFEALNAKIQLKDGIANLDPLTAQLPAVSLGGNGTLDLSSQELRASFRAQLSAALGELDPACSLNERLTDLRWPVECKGNLADDPAGWCGVNSAEIVKDLAEGELKRKAGKEAGKLFNKLFERD